MRLCLSQMGNCKGLAFMIGKWVPWSLRTGIIGLLMFAGFAYGDQMGVPETGLLCISDCTTCPVICSPPPPQQESHPPPSLSPSPPPPMHHSPPQSYYTSPPPSPPSPPPPSSPKESQSPPSYSSKGPPPPRFNYYFNLPPSGQVPPPTMPGPLHNFYYVYASEASSLSVHAFFLVIFLVHLVFSFW